MGWILPVSLGALLSASFLTPVAVRIWSVRRLRRECIRTRTLVLTYDDGPSPAMTPRLLALLQERGVKATFFMLGRHVARFPELVESVAAAGHEICAHSQEHVNAWKSLPWRSFADQSRGYESLKPWTGSRTPFRPPHGKLGAATLAGLLVRRAPPAWWTLDAGDTFTPLPDPSRAALSIQETGGGVVLLHDLSRSRERDEFVLEATRLLLDVAESEGFRVVTLGELMNWEH